MYIGFPFPVGVKFIGSVLACWGALPRAAPHPHQVVRGCHDSHFFFGARVCVSLYIFAIYTTRCADGEEPGAPCIHRFLCMQGQLNRHSLAASKGEQNSGAQYFRSALLLQR